jgi:uncharacterized Zn finger protein
MATRTEITLVCDKCGSEEAETHALTIDRKAVLVEACEKCWEKVTKAVDLFLEVGRRPSAKPRKVT